MSGYFGGWADNILLRLADILHTIPSLLLALVVLFVLQPSILNLIIVLGHHAHPGLPAHGARADPRGARADLRRGGAAARRFATGGS